nr:CAT RNA binding domain-containing protein [Enterococcus faecium]
MKIDKILNNNVVISKMDSGKKSFVWEKD